MGDLNSETISISRLENSREDFENDFYNSFDDLDDDVWDEYHLTNISPERVPRWLEVGRVLKIKVRIGEAVTNKGKVLPNDVSVNIDPSDDRTREFFEGKNWKSEMWNAFEGLEPKFKDIERTQATIAAARMSELARTLPVSSSETPNGELGSRKLKLENQR